MFLLLGVYTSVSNLVKIDEEMRPGECPQTDKHTHTHTRTHTRTDAKRFYYLSHAICYSYGADNNCCCVFSVLRICDDGQLRLTGMWHVYILFKTNQSITIADITTFYHTSRPNSSKTVFKQMSVFIHLA